jgi:hypothetical protein
MRLPTEGCGDLRAQGVLRVRLAMDDEHAARRPGEAAEPADDFALIGVRRHRVDLLDPGRHVDLTPEHFHSFDAVDERSAPRARRLVAHEQHRVARIGQRPGQVRQHPATRGHAARRHDDGRPGRLDEVGGLAR